MLQSVPVAYLGALGHVTLGFEICIFSSVLCHHTETNHTFTRLTMLTLFPVSQLDLCAILLGNGNTSRPPGYRWVSFLLICAKPVQ